MWTENKKLGTDIDEYETTQLELNRSKINH